MSDDPISIPIVRYIAIDAHKHYVMVGGMNARQEMVLPTRRVDMENQTRHQSFASCSTILTNIQTFLSLLG